MSKKNIKWILSAYFLLFVIMTLAPINNTSISLEKINIAGIRSDHLIHFFIFFPFALLVRSIKGVNYYSSSKRVLLWILIGLALAVFTELIQYFVPSKSCTANDLIANVIGIISGSFIFFIRESNKVNQN